MDHDPGCGGGDGLESGSGNRGQHGAVSFGPARGRLGGTVSGEERKRWQKEEWENSEGQPLVAVRAQSSGLGGGHHAQEEDERQQYAMFHTSSPL